MTGERMQERGAERSPMLGNLIVKLSGPLVTAKDQPPAPGSNWIIRAIWWGRRSGGWVLERLPSSTALWSQILRLAVIVWTWMLTAMIVTYAVLIWVFVVAPIAWIANRGKPKEPAVHRPPPPAATGWATRPEQSPSSTPAAPGWAAPPGSSVPPPPPSDLQVQVLERAPDPDPQPAVDACPMCGGVTPERGDTCGFCGVGLPMVVARGWHTDPLGGADRRWFDGERWTEFTRQGTS